MDEACDQIGDLHELRARFKAEIESYEAETARLRAKIAQLEASQKATCDAASQTETEREEIGEQGADCESGAPRARSSSAQGTQQARTARLGSMLSGGTPESTPVRQFGRQREAGGLQFGFSSTLAVPVNNRWTFGHGGEPEPPKLGNRFGQPSDVRTASSLAPSSARTAKQTGSRKPRVRSTVTTPKAKGIVQRAPAAAAGASRFGAPSLNTATSPNKAQSQVEKVSGPFTEAAAKKVQVPVGKAGAKPTSNRRIIKPGQRPHVTILGEGSRAVTPPSSKKTVPVQGEHEFGSVQPTIADGVPVIECTDEYYGRSIKEKVEDAGLRIDDPDQPFRVVVMHGSIRSQSFSGCSGLVQVTLPDQLEEVRELVFHDCFNLVSIEIPPSVRRIGSAAFFGCSKLESLTLPANVEEIESDAFHGCSKLADMRIPDGVKFIGTDVFNGCSRLVSVTLPPGLTKIPGGAFYRCSTLKSVVIPHGVRFIGDLAFSGCVGLESVEIPETVITINDGVFSGCSKLTAVYIPARVKQLREGVFRGCTSLKTLVLPDGVTVLGNGVFYNCVGLTSMAVPGTVECISKNAFYGCSGLTSVTISEGVTKIGDSAFKGCGQLRSIRLPPGISHVGNAAFMSCFNLTAVIIPSGTVGIGASAFCHCASLVVVACPNSIVECGHKPFHGCRQLTYLAAPEIVRDAASADPLVPLKLIDQDTVAGRRQLLRLQYWSLTTHRQCSPPRRVWVAWIMLFAARLREESSPLPSLPMEMWVAILELVPRWALGP